MASQDASAFLPPGRRASLFSKQRPMTSCGLALTPEPSSDVYFDHARTTAGHESGVTLLEAGAGAEGSAVSTYAYSVPHGQQSTYTPLVDHDPALTRSASKSISSLRSGAHEIGSLVRKMSLSLRPKSSKHKQGLSNASNAAVLALESSPPSQGLSNRSRSSTWFRTQRPHRRPSLPLLSRPSMPILTEPTGVPYRRPSVPAPMPGTGPVPPIVPQDLNNGAAARAAAAAQNEALAHIESLSELRKITPPVKEERRMSDRLSELKLTRDSESGIGIDMRDHAEPSFFDENVVRQDPALILPTEIMELILAYLDPTSLMNAELVSSKWNNQGRSRHVWRHTFHREYDRRNAVAARLPRSARLPAPGLGKQSRDQDWKRMYRVRRALEQRWIDGQAAAIYLNGHKDSVYCVQFDEHKIITGSRDQTIRVWDARTYQCIKIIGAPVSHGQHPIPPTWSPPLSTRGLVPLCSINTTSPLPKGRKNNLPPADYHKASVLCLQFDSEIMVTGSSDSTCIMWSITDNYAPIRRLRGHTAGVLDVCFDDHYIVTCSKDTTICVWDRSSGELLKRLAGHRGPVNAVQLKGNLVVSASGDGIAKLWNLSSGLCIKEFPSRDRGLACVEFSEDGKTILAGGNDQVIYQFDANTGEMVRELKGHKGLVRSLHLDTVNHRVVSGSYDMSIKVWDAERGCDLADGGLKLDFEGWTTSWMLAAKSDYRRVVATSQDGRAVILDFGYGLDGVELLEG